MNFQKQYYLEKYGREPEIVKTHCFYFFLASLFCLTISAHILFPNVTFDTLFLNGKISIGTLIGGIGILLLFLLSSGFLKNGKNKERDSSTMNTALALFILNQILFPIFKGKGVEIPYEFGYLFAFLFITYLIMAIFGHTPINPLPSSKNI